MLYFADQNLTKFSTTTNDANNGFSILIVKVMSFYVIYLYPQPIHNSLQISTTRNSTFMFEWPI